MKRTVQLERLLTASGKSPRHQLTVFALLNLGLIESLANGSMGVNDAIEVFFNAENCLFVRKQLRKKTADAIMSHGVQLPDLFQALSPSEAHREFQHELAVMRTLCLKLLDRKELVA